MNSRQTVSIPETQRLSRNALVISLLSNMGFAGLVLSMFLSRNMTLLWLAGLVLLVTILATWLLYQGRHLWGVSLLMAAIALYLAVEPVWVRGSSVYNAVLAVSILGSIGLLTLPRIRFGRVVMWSSIAGAASVFVDLFGPSGRLLTTFESARLLIAFVLLVLFIILLARAFPSLEIRTKIVLGILTTGGLALGVFSVFAVAQTAQISNSLSGRLETSVSLLAEEQLINTVNAQAELTNQSFKDVLDSVESFADNWVSLQGQKRALSQGNYWNATTGLVQLEDGRYGNLSSDVSSLYVPAGTDLNEALIEELNTSAYLDFYAPAVLKKYSSLLAVYAIDTKGVTRYYPNINLAAILPPGFDARQRPYYEITAPLFNPKRTARWTIPYVDATGGGLVVTVAAPIYIGDNFNGIVAADMQLTTITKQVSALKLGLTGYSFMIDDAGHILSMPDAGYELFGINEDEIKPEEFFKVSLLSAGSSELRAITSRMAAGGSGLLIVKAHGVDNYISFAPIKANGYSLALVVPVHELQRAIITARNETEAQLASGARASAVIMFSLLVFAVLISLGIGQIISTPIIRLTQTANEIVDGNLAAQANVPSKDEIGTLAQAFNTMTSRLRETLQGLELRVEERTSQLKIANERNERRAKQFEAISQVASTISSTRDLDTLLNQVASAISARFGFYHVGIFLLDPRQEYAVLSAANSDGGKRMLARQHRLRVGETGIVGFVTSTGRPRIALDTVEDAVFFNNPDLPETHSEIALPLMVEDEVIGALDVQSTELNAFEPEDVNILIALADQVAIAIQNSRQFEQTRKALTEADALSRQFVQSGWRQFTKTQNLIGVHHTGAKATLLYANNGDGKNGSHSKQEEERTRNRGTSISLPVKLRGEVIGSVDVRSPDNQKWDQDDLDVVTAIIERAAIAMENARLLAESQKRAAKERTIGEISAKISAQSDIDELLKIAAQELNRTLPGAEIAIQFSKDEAAE